MSELLENKVNSYLKREFGKNTSGVHVSSRKPTRRCVMKMKETRKNNVCKNFNERKWFISHTRGTGEMDRYEMLVNNSLYNEGTICLVNRINAKGMVLRAWAHEQAP